MQRWRRRWMASACKTGLDHRAPVRRSEPNTAEPAVPSGRSGLQDCRGLHEDPADAAQLRRWAADAGCTLSASRNLRTLLQHFPRVRRRGLWGQVTSLWLLGGPGSRRGGGPPRPHDAPGRLSGNLCPGSGGQYSFTGMHGWAFVPLGASTRMGTGPGGVLGRQPSHALPAHPLSRDC